MSGDNGEKSTTPSLTDAAQARAEEREQRRAAALRANLARRKSQSRAREADERPASPLPAPARK